MYINIRLCKIRIRIFGCSKQKKIFLQPILCDLLFQFFTFRSVPQNIPPRIDTALLQEMHRFDRHRIRFLLRQTPNGQDSDSGIRIGKSSTLFCPFTDLIHIDHIVKNARSLCTLRINLYKLIAHLLTDRKQGIIFQITVTIKFSRIACLLIINVNKRRLFLRFHMIRNIVRRSAFQESDRQIIGLILSRCPV